MVPCHSVGSAPTIINLFDLSLGDKERYKAHAEKQGKSLTALIVDLIEADIKVTEEKQ